MVTPFEVRFDGAVLRGEADGFGMPVVFLHSGITDRRMWADQMALLSAEGYHVICYDRRGFGETSAPDEPFSHVVDLEAVLDQLSIHAAVFVGSSLGGGLAVDFAIEHPNRTIGLVLVATALTGAEQPEMPDEIAEIEDALEYSLERGAIDSAARIEAHLWLDGPTSLQGRVEGDVRQRFVEMCRLVLRHPKLSKEEEADPAIDTLSLVTAPVLLIVGDLDYFYIVDRHEDLSEEFENGFALVLEGCAHFPNLERPDLFDPLLLEFLEAIEGVAAPEGEPLQA